MDKTLKKIIGEKIRDTRSEKGLKQADLANVIGSTAALISNIENGGQSIQLIDLYKIAELLKKEVAYFLPSLKELKEAMPSLDREIGKLPSKEAEFVDEIRSKQIKKED